VKRWADGVLANVISPSVTKLGYLKPVRGDKISSSDLITTQIVNYLVEADLVIADLTEQSPSVFYELAIRHAVKKPVVHIIKEGDDLPFGFKKAHVISISSNLKNPKIAIKRLTDQIALVEKEKDDFTFIKDYSVLRNAFTEGILSASDKQSLFNIFTDMYSSIQVIEGQITKLDNKINTIRGDVRALQLSSLPSPFVERRLAKFESIKYKVQQKRLGGSVVNDS